LVDYLDFWWKFLLREFPEIYVNEILGQIVFLENFGENNGMGGKSLFTSGRELSCIICILTFSGSSSRSS